MIQIIMNEKLGITPENLFRIVRNYLVFYVRKNEDGKTANNYYKSEQSPNTNSSIIHITNIRGEWMGDISVLPLTMLRARVFVTFDDWESNPREHVRAEGWGGATFDQAKKQMFLDLGSYILETVSSRQRADAWLKTTKEFLEKQAALGIELEDLTKPWERMSKEPAHEAIMVRLLYEGYSNAKIREYLHEHLGEDIEPKTVDNRFSDIRKRYPFVQTKREIRKNKTGN